MMTLLTHCILVDSSTVNMLDESICHFWGVRSILSLFYFSWKILLANSVGPDQTSHYVISDRVCTVCL